MISFSKNKIARYTFILFLIAGLSFIVFNDTGYVKYIRLKGEVDELRTKISEKQSENKNLEAEIDSLEKKNPDKIEQIAREKYGMMKKDEKIIKVEEK